MSTMGIAKSVYKTRTRTNSPATGRAVISLVEKAAMVLKQAFITSVTIKVNMRYVLLGLSARTFF